MSRLKSFQKFNSVDKEESNKIVWIVLSCLVLVITLVLFSSYAKYLSTSREVSIVNSTAGDFYYTEPLLNGTDPVLTDNLVPVNISNTGSVSKADLYNEWYKYEDKRWANAVVLRTPTEMIGVDNVYGGLEINNIPQLDGVDDGIDVGFDNYDFSSKFSLAITFKIDKENVGKNTVIIGNWEGAGGGIYYYDGNIYGELFITEINEYVDIIVPLSDIDKFHTVVLTYDGNFMRFYIDGDEVSSYEAIGNIKPSPVPIYIGGNPTTNGLVDKISAITVKDYAVYNRTLSADEVSSDMSNNIVVRDTSDLLSYINFDNNYVNNEIIPEDNIESYFVWIPKYSYQLWDLGNYNTTSSVDNSKVHSIGIRFGTTNTSDGVLGECTTPGIAGSSGNCVVGDYMTHPAFLAFDTNGLWVGKFETGYEGATTIEDAHQNVVSVDNIVIKSNEFSWRAIGIANAFTNSYNYLRSSDSHLMKNTEWGAVAYLSHSIYGINTEVRLNNNSAYLTGYSSVEIPTKTLVTVSTAGNRYEYTNKNLDGIYTINYFNNNSVMSSTTGNYTGIYDMSGGAWEVNFAYTENLDEVVGKTDLLSLYSDIFTNSSWEKYYDKYLSNSITNYNNRILGDATGEMGPFWLQEDLDGITRGKSSWYNDYANFPEPTDPFFNRGGAYCHGVTNGLFAFAKLRGQAGTDTSYRIVLAPKN